MHFSRLRIPLAITAALGMLSGCSSKEPAPEPYTGTPFEVQQYEPDLRGHHTSWGHSGRGGAALRKPSYQPVLGSRMSWIHALASCTQSCRTSRKRLQPASLYHRRYGLEPAWINRRRIKRLITSAL